MILTKDLQNASYAYARAETHLGAVIKNLDQAIEHLKYIKKLHLKGVVKHSCYQSYKASTANYRARLVEQLKQAKTEKHNTWRTYDKIKKEFDRQDTKSTILQDALAKLNQEQKQALKEYFLKN